MFIYSINKKSSSILKGYNEKRIFSNEQFNTLYPDFNIKHYKRFIKNIQLSSDDEYLFKWHNEYYNFIDSYNLFNEQFNEVLQS